MLALRLHEVAYFGGQMFQLQISGLVSVLVRISTYFYYLFHLVREWAKSSS